MSNIMLSFIRFKTDLKIEAFHLSIGSLKAKLWQYKTRDILSVQ